MTISSKDIDALRTNKPSDDDLRESLRAYGYRSEHPVIQDENGVVLVGNRRLRIAKEEGIEPVIKIIKLGKGEDADIERVKIAVSSNVGGICTTTQDRKNFAIHLHNTQGWTQQQIAEAVGVSQRMVSKYLVNLEPSSKSKKTATNPKGAGRKKGSKAKQRHRKPEITRDSERAAARAYLDGDATTVEQAAATFGLGSMQAGKIAVAKERGRREAFDEMGIKAGNEDLPLTMQQRVNIIIKRKTEEIRAQARKEYDERLERHMNEYLLPQFAKEAADAARIVKSRKGVMSRALFREIKACLHPDRVDEALKPRYQKAFNEFSELELLLCDEKQSPTRPEPVMPKGYSDFMKMKQKADAARRSKRDGKANMERAR